MDTDSDDARRPRRAAAERDATAYLSAIVAASQDALISKDLDGYITTWNPAAEVLYGYPPEQVIGHHAGMLAHPDDQGLEATMLARASGGESVSSFRTRRMHQSGTVLEVTLSLAPIRDRDGSIIGVASVSREIGDRTIWETRFQGMLEAAPDAMISVDRDGTITLVNNQVEHLFGYTRAELVGQNIDLLVPSAVRPRHPRLRAGYATHPTSRPMGAPDSQLSAQRKDGSTFRADISLGYLDIDGDTVVTAAVRDVTDRIAIQDALRESDSHFRQLAQNIDVAFLLRALDPPAILYASPGFAKIYGLEPGAETPFNPERFLGMIHPEDSPGVLADYWPKASRGLAAEAEYRIIRPDGVVSWVRATCSPVIDPDGVIRRCAGTAEDITGRKLAEAALRSAHAEAEQANTAKSEFLSRMSHELRTPLNAVLGFAQLLALDQLTPDQDDAVKYILRGGRHLLGLIDDVLDIAKIESDRLDLSLEPVTIAELLAETVVMMKPVADSSGIALSYRPEHPESLQIYGDRRRLRQVVLNLLSNAVKYNRLDGSVKVRSSVAGSSGNLEIIVEDTGHGIRAQDMPRLFTPFDRLGAQSTGVDGTGVGLTLSQGLMATMGGTLRGASTVGVGSVFTASIPLATAVQRAASTPVLRQAGLSSAADYPAETAPHTLVYIEDNNSNLELMERLVSRRRSWRMMVARLGMTGLELAAATSPDLILLDLHLPDMDGFEVLHRLRADPRTSEVPIVVVSADANAHQITRLLAAGAQQYLTKPLEVAKVLELLDSVEVALAASTP